MRQEESGSERGWPRSLNGIRIATRQIWQRPLHRYYTDHSVEHSKRIIEKLSKLTETLVQETRTGISSTEVYVLLAAAYLHDIGMQDENYEGGDLEEIRNNHHKLTRKLITERYAKQSDRSIPLGFNDLVPVDIVDTIAAVAEAHRKTDLRDSQYNEFYSGDGSIRPRFLAALLRLADELDIDYRRVNMQFLGLLDVSDLSRFHWSLCHYVSGVKIQYGRITVHYRFPEGCDEYSRIVEPLVRENIQKEFPLISDILWDHGCRVELSDKHEQKFFSGLETMSPEVIAFAAEQRKRRLGQAIANYEEEFQFCDSLSQASIGERVERFDG